ncbi:unnamed protein product [Phytophthora fragariaefolia]|uniref:Unnamed protein product n=1 Tax=Phytophthora fragariaefolia TaxID=1490495 RepID=A0A9W7CSA2_9STRA|nr:unnamed protein product [Phytophthora fragariaefolia]
MKRLQLDINTAFLDFKLREQIYLDPVEGYQNNDGHVCVFPQGKVDTCMFVKIDGAEQMVVLVYVDDMLVFGESDEAVDSFELAMENAYVNHFAGMNFFLGLESSGLKLVTKSEPTRSTHPPFLTSFAIDKCRAAATPMEEHYRNQLFEEQDLTNFKPRPALGALLYMSELTRPDLATAVR